MARSYQYCVSHRRSRPSHSSISPSAQSGLSPLARKLGMAGACSLLASPELSIVSARTLSPQEKGQRNADPLVHLCLWRVNQFCMGHLQRRPSHRSISTSAQHPAPQPTAGHGGRLSSAPRLGSGERPHSIPQHASFMIRSAQVPGVVRLLEQKIPGIAGCSCFTQAHPSEWPQ